jgi:hypothetical protein
MTKWNHRLDSHPSEKDDIDDDGDDDDAAVDNLEFRLAGLP